MNNPPRHRHRDPTTRPEAEDLLARIAAGDRAALVALYEGTAALLLAVALRVTRCRFDAEEVVQDTLLRAWREAASFDRHRGSALAWLATLARNRAIDVVRGRGRRSRRDVSWRSQGPQR